MNPVLGTAALWLAMLGTHIGLASRRPRTALVARLGEQGYLFLDRKSTRLNSSH